MSIYLKKFETQAAYEAAQSSLILPNVSLTVDNNTVHYNPSTPPTPSHDYVEIGGVKWATMNVGANSITDTGLYLQWGDTQGYTADQVGCEEGKKCFDLFWKDYKWTEDEGRTFTKYDGSDYTVLEASDDAVTVAWGDNWKMPTREEYAALGAAVNTEWTADYQGSGVAGMICTDKNDGSKVLFFPACGLCSDGSVSNVNSYGIYWSSSLLSGNVQKAYRLLLYSGTVNWQTSLDRYVGLPVRGVLAE